jgi:hypothetical protein
MSANPPACLPTRIAGRRVRLAGSARPVAPEQAVHPRVGHVTVDDAVLAQCPLEDEAKLLQHTGRCHVARISLGLNPVEVEGLESPLVLSVTDLADVAVIDVADDLGVKRPRPLAAGGALVVLVTACSAW